MVNSKVILPILLVLAVLVGGYLLLSDNRDTINTPSEGGSINTLTPSISTPQTKTFEISGKSYSFTPNEIRVRKGDTVNIVFTNTEGFHDLQIEGYNIGTNQIAANQSDTIQFVADKSGSFVYYCSVGDHRQRGMVGNLIVED